MMEFNNKQIELIEAYKKTLYQVNEPKISIQIGSFNPDLEKLLKEYGVNSWCYITAWNPWGRNYTSEENEKLQSALLKDIEGYHQFSGEGKGFDTEWPPEKSVLVLGISLADAISLGNQYNQNAIVYGDNENLPNLKLLKAFDLIL